MKDIVTAVTFHEVQFMSGKGNNGRSTNSRCGPYHRRYLPSNKETRCVVWNSPRRRHLPSPVRDKEIISAETRCVVWNSPRRHLPFPVRVPEPIEANKEIISAVQAEQTFYPLITSFPPEKGQEWQLGGPCAINGQMQYWGSRLHVDPEAKENQELTPEEYVKKCMDGGHWEQRQGVPSWVIPLWEKHLLRWWSKTRTGEERYQHERAHKKSNWVFPAWCFYPKYFSYYKETYTRLGSQDPFTGLPQKE